MSSNEDLAQIPLSGDDLVEPSDILEDSGLGDLVRLVGSNIAERPELFDLLKQIAKAIVQTFGADICEVVIHDLADLEHSIVWIEGDVTHRRIGGSMTDLGLELVQAGETQDLFVYRSQVDGKTLQSSSVFLRDQDGRAWGSFCINFNITPLLQFQRYLESMVPVSPKADFKERFTDDIEETLHQLILDATERIGKPLSELTREERLELVRALEHKGAFLVRRAVPFIAQHLNVTRYTIYNYLAEIRGSDPARSSLGYSKTE